MPNVFRRRMALTGVALLLAGGCSDDGAPTIAGAGGPTSSAPATTTTVAPPVTTTAPTPTTMPAGPAAAEAGGWRLAVTAPTRNGTIGPALDLCYEATGPAPADLAFEVSLIFAATRTVASTVRVDATAGRGSARVNLGTPEPRRYDFTVQAIVNGRPVDGLAVTFGVLFGAAPPAGCP